jgi:hypothetical protein
MMGVTQLSLFFAEYTYAYVIEDQRGGVSRFYARADGGLVLLSVVHFIWDSTCRLCGAVLGLRIHLGLSSTL